MPRWSAAWEERARPDGSPFMITDRVRLTHGDIREAASRSASWLKSLGIGTDEVVVGITGTASSPSTLQPRQASFRQPSGGSTSG